ncbi:hypothetical protein C1I98_12250 [Spongiactinospora gelatinilytica]|uniref:DUF11 domain-containing protein n=1 Tax=Spongiactinospora gelatinilytica TaxID=2666298 RepID=A0A2W2HGX5_9ACTN|nr:hypothetical protein [Spongiactinospora gelatinilytica]PZG48868.1 hypothetical protein C1I98_12250 [Spongiactinospora gelatinilytica]
MALITYTSGADLDVSITDSPAPVSLGTTVAYNATVTSSGPEDATGTTPAFGMAAGSPTTSCPPHPTWSCVPDPRRDPTMYGIHASAVGLA